MFDGYRTRLTIGAVTCASLALLAALLATAADGAEELGQQIVEHGSADGAAPCVSCHGAGLRGNPSVGAPAIAGLPKAFIVARLNHYAGPSGHNPAMKQIAAALTPEEREAVATSIAAMAQRR